MNNITSRYSGGDGSEMTIHSACHQLTDLCSFRREYARGIVQPVSVLISDRSMCRSRRCDNSDSSHCGSERLLGGTTQMLNRACCRLRGIAHIMFSFKQFLLIMFTLSVLTFLNSPLASAEVALPYPDSVYVQNLLYEFGNNETITVKQLDKALEAITTERTCDHHPYGSVEGDSPSSVIGCGQLNQRGLNATYCIDQPVSFCFHYALFKRKNQYMYNWFIPSNGFITYNFSTPPLPSALI